jgi:UDP-N-acetylmuramyl pentapeptide phosphotransferase/UDP-N-acetylglucosamine-1-phosphate transferase
MEFIIYPILITVLFLAELWYFRIADKYNIIDKPNERSSHTTVTLRGGGVIFVLPPLLFTVLNGGEYIWFSLGLVIISIISFIDDMRGLSGRVRIIVHLIAVSLMFYGLQVFGLHWWLIATAYVLVIGTINAYNFMDGINGITGSYSLVVLISLLLANIYYPFIEAEFIIYAILGTLVFLFFNFRQKAKCFAGDVGSVAMAFVVLFLLIDLIQTTGDFRFILFLGIYGVDSVLTIAHRLILRENIFVAHRLHLYQFLTNKLKWPHLAVSTLYALVQAVISGWVIFASTMNLFEFILILSLLGVLYVVIKLLIIKDVLKPIE